MDEGASLAPAAGVGPQPRQEGVRQGHQVTRQPAALGQSQVSWGSRDQPPPITAHLALVRGGLPRPGHHGDVRAGAGRHAALLHRDPRPAGGPGPGPIRGDYPVSRDQLSTNHSPPGDQHRGGAEVQRLLHRGLQRGRGLLQQLLHTRPLNIFNCQPEFKSQLFSCRVTQIEMWTCAGRKRRFINTILLELKTILRVFTITEITILAALRIYANQTILLVPG